MAIIIRHRTLSQKTQSAIAGIISKNEWNDTHVIDNVAESDIVFSSTGHNHDGIGSAISVKCNTLNDSYLSSVNYRSASKYPQANEIPILDGDGYMNIRRVGSTQYSKIQFNDSTTPKSSIYHDYTSNILTLTNVTGINTISLLSTGEITITPKSTTPLTVTIDNVHLKNIVATDNSEVRLNFKDSSSVIKGYLGYIYHSTTTSNIITLRNTLSGGTGCYVNLDGGGNIIINTYDGTSGKAYYTKSGLAQTALDELATLRDTDRFTYTTSQLYTSVTSTAWTVPPGVYKVLAIIQGGGGGGGGGGVYPGIGKGSGGGGGGEGGKITALLDVTPYESFTVIVGDGGNGGATGSGAGATGSTGGSSTFNNLVALGGVGGVGGVYIVGVSTGGAGGAGGLYTTNITRPTAGGAGGASGGAPATAGSAGGASKTYTVGDIRTVLSSDSDDLGAKRNLFTLAPGRDGGNGGNGQPALYGGGGGGAGVGGGAGNGGAGSSGGGGGGGHGSDGGTGGKGGVGYVKLYY